MHIIWCFHVLYGSAGLQLDDAAGRQLTTFTICMLILKTNKSTQTKNHDGERENLHFVIEQIIDIVSLQCVPM